MTTYALLTLQILSAMAFAFALQLFSRGSLAVVNQLSTRSENDGAEHAHLQGGNPEVVEREAADTKEMLYQWYQTNVKMIVEAIPPGLVSDFKFIGFSLIFMSAHGIMFRHKREQQAKLPKTEDDRVVQAFMDKNAAEYKSKDNLNELDYLARSPGVKREASAMEGLGSQNLSAMAFALQLFSHGSLAVASQLLTSSGVSSEFVESEAVDPKEMLHPWYQTNVKMIVEAIPPGLVSDFKFIGFSLIFMSAYGIMFRHKREHQARLPKTDDDRVVQAFMDKNAAEYKSKDNLNELGSRMKKSWYLLKKKERGQDAEDSALLTVAPIPQNCPLSLTEHEAHLQNVLEAIKLHKHPFVQPIDKVEYHSRQEKIVFVQPYRREGSLKDQIYKVEKPLVEWSKKYARRSKGIPPEKVALYGRQILEAMKFLYSQGFPTLGHVQTGNIFVVNDVCQLGGYENTLLGYKTRLFRLCKDHTDHLDVILFGHVVFEMSSGYELTQLRPEAVDYRDLPSSVKPILEFIFTDGFTNSIKKISEHHFFAIPPPELEKYNSSSVKLTETMKDSMKIIMEILLARSPVAKREASAIFMEGERGSSKGPFWKNWHVVPKQVKQLFKKKEEKTTKHRSSPSPSSKRAAGRGECRQS